MNKKLLAMLLCAVMLLGMVSASAEEHEHVDVDGNYRCEVCNQCIHPESEVDIWVEIYDKTYTPVDNVVHTVSGEAYECFWCNWCGFSYEKSIGIVTEEEAHNYLGGNVCGMCEHENTCEHTETKVVVDRGSGGVYTPVDSEKHRYSGHKEVQERCAECNQLLGWIDEGGYVSEEEAHEFDADGKCPCGYVKEAEPSDEPTTEPTDEPSNRTEMDETGWITGGTVNVRAGAGTDYDRIGSVYFANELHIVASVENDKGEVWSLTMKALQDMCAAI